MNFWELTKEQNGWGELSTNLVNLNVHFPISTTVVLKIKHAEECTIILRVLCWHGDIRESPIWNVREWRSSKHLKNIVKSSTDLDGNVCVIPVLVILLFPVLRIQNLTCLWTLLIQYTIQCALLSTGMNICWKHWSAIKNNLQMNCKECLKI
jgi:hypothetical protein